MFWFYVAIIMILLGAILFAVIGELKDKTEEKRRGLAKSGVKTESTNNRETNRCLKHETNQLEFCAKVIHVLHCEFCQSKLRSVYPDKFKKEEREIVKQQERI